MNQLEVIYLKPDQLTPYEKNTRKHTIKDVEGIKKSILDTGFNDPIGIWGKKNLIIEGHGRLLAAKELHLETVPCIRLDHLTDEQRREYAIRHNRSAEMSSWDFDILSEELARLDLDGIDMSDLDFTLNGGGEVAPSTDSSFHYQEQYAVTVLVKDEEEQKEVYERLTGEGYECKVVCV